MSDHQELLARLDEWHLYGAADDVGLAAAAIRQLESDLASERVKRVEAEALAERWKSVDAVTVTELLTAEATIAQARAYAKDRSIHAGAKNNTVSSWRIANDLDEILANADTSALARHDAEVAARALEEAADDLRRLFADPERQRPQVGEFRTDLANDVEWAEMTIRARAAEKRAEQ